MRDKEMRQDTRGHKNEVGDMRGDKMKRKRKQKREFELVAEKYHTHHDR